MADQTKKVAIKELDQLEGEDLLGQMIDTGIKPKGGDAGRQRAQELLKTFVGELLDPSFVVEKGVTKTINARIAAIDEMLSKQVNAILHHPELQKLEASWRGLNKLVMGSETGEAMKIRVFNVAKKDLLNVFQAAAEFTESALWKKVYEYEFGLYGGDPYGAMIGDYEFDKGPQDISLLTHLSQVSAASHAPLVTAAAPQMFAMDSFTQMPDPRDLVTVDGDGCLALGDDEEPDPAHRPLDDDVDPRAELPHLHLSGEPRQLALAEPAEEPHAGEIVGDRRHRAII